MRKITLFFASMLVGMGAWAQDAKTPVVELTDSEIGTTFPYEMTAEDAEKVFGLTDLTIVMKVNTSTLSGRMALFCTSDPTQNANTVAMPTGSHYVAYGTSGTNSSYLASCVAGDRYSSGTISANTNNVILAYVLNPTNTNYKAYIDETEVMNRNFGNYEIATPKMVKEDHANAKIYIGGGVKADNATFETFNGEILGVKVFDGVLTAEEIKQVFPEDATELKSELNTLMTTVAEFLAKGYTCDEVTTLSTKNAEAQGVYDDADATVDEINGVIDALTAAYDAAKEYPFVASLVKNIEEGNYYIYYTDEEDVKHYLQTSGANSIVTVTEGAVPYEVAAGTTSGGKYTKAYTLKMNNLYISNTSQNATNIETKDNVQIWTSQVVFEKDGKCAIRLTNATAVDKWHGNYLIGKGETAGTTIALDPTTALEEAMFIWQFEKYDANNPSTDIEPSTLNSQLSTAIYDLTGRRVEKMEKGIYIVNGRKVLVK